MGKIKNLKWTNAQHVNKGSQTQQAVLGLTALTVEKLKLSDAAIADLLQLATNAQNVGLMVLNKNGECYSYIEGDA